MLVDMFPLDQDPTIPTVQQVILTPNLPTVHMPHSDSHGDLLHLRVNLPGLPHPSTLAHFVYRPANQKVLQGHTPTPTANRFSPEVFPEDLTVAHLL